MQICIENNIDLIHITCLITKTMISVKRVCQQPSRKSPSFFYPTGCNDTRALSPLWKVIEVKNRSQTLHRCSAGPSNLRITAMN